MLTALLTLTALPGWAAGQKPQTRAVWLERSVAAGLKAAADGQASVGTLDAGAVAAGFVNHLKAAEVATPPGWLQRSSLQWDISDPKHARLNVRTLQPLAAVAGGTVLFQNRFSYGVATHKAKVPSAAIGYRRFADRDRLMLGLGGRLEPSQPWVGERTTLRSELRSSPLDLTATWKITQPRPGAPATARPGHRYNLSSRLRLPYMNYARLQTWYTDNTTPAGFNSQSQRYALWLSPLPHLNLEANYHDDSAATEGWGVAMRFTMKLHDPHATRRAPFFADQPYEMASMRSHQLDPLY